MAHRILVVDDEESIRYTFKEFLDDHGYEVDTADTLIEGAAMVGAVEYDAIFLDILLGRESGINLLKVVHEQSPNCPVTMVTGAPEIKTAAEAVRHGAFDYLTKPLAQDELVRQAQRAVAYKTALDLKELYQKRLAAVFDGVREGILVFDVNLALLEINFAGRQMLACDQSVLGLRLPQLTAQLDSSILETIGELISSRFDGELYRIEALTDSGEPRHFSVSISSLTSSHGQDADLVVVLREETETRAE